MNKTLITCLGFSGDTIAIAGTIFSLIFLNWWVAGHCLVLGTLMSGVAVCLLQNERISYQETKDVQKKD